LGAYMTDPKLDSSSLRCFDQKRRFGIDLLYPVKRYVDALKENVIPNRAGTLVPNPIFQAPAGTQPRGKDLVLLAGIVGVPWQDIATDASLEGPGLEYLRASELEAKQRWDLLLGSNGNPASDPFMREAVDQRSGQHPFLNAPVVPAESNLPDNPINGHEQ